MHVASAVPALQFPSLPKMLLALEHGFALGKFAGSPDLQSGLAQTYGNGSRKFEKHRLKSTHATW